MSYAAPRSGGRDHHRAGRAGVVVSELWGPGLGQGPPGRLLRRSALRRRADHVALAASTGSSAPTRSARSARSPLAITGSPRSGAGSAPGRPNGWPSRSPAVRPSAHLAGELACGWDAINVAVRIYGAAWLAADTKRLKETTAIGLDESLFCRAGPYKHKVLVDHRVRRGQPRSHRRAPHQGLHCRRPLAARPAPPCAGPARLRVPRHVQDLRRRLPGRHPQGDTASSTASTSCATPS